MFHTGLLASSQSKGLKAGADQEIPDRRRLCPFPRHIIRAIRPQIRGLFPSAAPVLRDVVQTARKRGAQPVQGLCLDIPIKNAILENVPDYAVRPAQERSRSAGGGADPPYEGRGHRLLYVRRGHSRSVGLPFPLTNPLFLSINFHDPVDILRKLRDNKYRNPSLFHKNASNCVRM